MREWALHPDLGVVAISLRERARAIVGIAVAERGETAHVVDGALELLVREPDDDGDLGARFGLSPLAEAVLTLALAPDLAPDLGAGFAYLADDPTARRPSLRLALTLLQEHPELGLGPLHELAERGLLHARPRGIEPLLEAPLVPTEGLVAHLLGAPTTPPNLALADQLGIEPHGGDLQRPEIARATAAGAVCDLIHLFGVDRTSLREVAVDIAASLGRAAIFAVDVDPDPDLIAELTREATLRSAVAILDLGDASARRTALSIGALPVPVLNVGTSASPPRVQRDISTMSIEVAPLSPAERAAVWAGSLRAAHPGHATRLGYRYRLSRSEIRAAIEHGERAAHAAGRDVAEIADLEAGARAQTGADLARLAPRVEVRSRRPQMVLTDDARAQLDELVARVDHRLRVVDEWGFGERRSVHPTTALFVGPSGTGKSMAAEAISDRLGLALHRIDLSRVVSKYIGETERQLDEIFEAASRTNAVLFFDEADALFGKRSEVRDAHDRYANLEVSYLLQRMETYDGVALLATNLSANIDDAFTRRLDFTVHFPFPGPVARRALWTQAWPQRTPCDDLDETLAELADTYELSGGNIRNIAVASAYLAASNGGVVGPHHVRHALRRELQKLGAIIDPSDELVVTR